jgi:hypothetical protein
VGGGKEGAYEFGAVDVFTAAVGLGGCKSKVADGGLAVGDPEVGRHVMCRGGGVAGDGAALGADGLPDNPLFVSVCERCANCWCREAKNAGEESFSELHRGGLLCLEIEGGWIEM